MLKGKYAGEPFRILTVPKDIDAMMSVGYGIDGFALSTGNSLEELKTLNPVLCSKMSILAEGEPSLLLVLAAAKGLEQDVAKISKILLDMSSDPEGRRKIRMLGLDRWQRIDAGDMKQRES